MGEYVRSIVIEAPISQVFHFHDDSANLIAISPPDLHVTILEESGPVGVGHRVRLRMRQFGFLKQELLIEFVEYDPPHRLVDVQVKGPFRSWRQIRQFEEVAEGTRMTDRVEYALPFGPVGTLVDRLFVANQVRRMFEWRQSRTKQILEVRGSEGRNDRVA